MTCFHSSCCKGSLIYCFLCNAIVRPQFTAHFRAAHLITVTATSGSPVFLVFSLAFACGSAYRTFLEFYVELQSHIVSHLWPEPGGRFLTVDHHVPLSICVGGAPTKVLMSGSAVVMSLVCLCFNPCPLFPCTIPSFVSHATSRVFSCTLYIVAHATLGRTTAVMSS